MSQLVGKEYIPTNYKTKDNSVPIAVNVIGDGNCLYRSLAVVRGWQEYDFCIIKCIIAAQLLKYPTKYFTKREQAFERISTLLQAKGQDCWGGPEELRMYADATCCIVALHNTFDHSNIPNGPAFTYIPEVFRMLIYGLFK